MVYRGAQHCVMPFCFAETQNALSKSSAVGVSQSCSPQSPYNGVNPPGFLTGSSPGIGALMATCPQLTAMPSALQNCSMTGGLSASKYLFHSGLIPPAGNS